MGSACTGSKSQAVHEPTTKKTPVYSTQEQMRDEQKKTLVFSTHCKQFEIGIYFSDSKYSESKSISYQVEQARKISEWQARIQLASSKLRDQQFSKLFTSKNQSYINTYYEKCLLVYFVLKEETFLEIVEQGPPRQFRWVCWKILMHNETIYEPNLYDELVKRDSPHQHSISKDVGRTFPDHPYYKINSDAAAPISEQRNQMIGIDQKGISIGQEQLYRVLKAISLYFPNIGYTQGMNMLVGFILLVNGGNESEAFWFFINLSRNLDILIIGFLQDTFPLLEIYFHIFTHYFNKLLPELKEHFNKEGFTEPLWLWQWYLTLFIYSFPLEFVLRIWDYIFKSRSLFSIIGLSLAILTKLQPVLLTMDLNDLNIFFQRIKDDQQMILNPESDNYLNFQEIVQIGKNVQITKKTVANLVKQYINLQKSEKTSPENTDKKAKVPNEFSDFYQNYNTQMDKSVIQQMEKEILLQINPPNATTYIRIQNLQEKPHIKNQDSPSLILQNQIAQELEKEIIPKDTLNAGNKDIPNPQQSNNNNNNNDIAINEQKKQNIQANESQNKIQQKSSIQEIDIGDYNSGNEKFDSAPVSSRQPHQISINYIGESEPKPTLNQEERKSFNHQTNSQQKQSNSNLADGFQNIFSSQSIDNQAQKSNRVVGGIGSDSQINSARSNNQQKDTDRDFSEILKEINEQSGDQQPQNDTQVKKNFWDEDQDLKTNFDLNQNEKKHGMKHANHFFPDTKEEIEQVKQHSEIQQLSKQASQTKTYQTPVPKPNLQEPSNQERKDSTEQIIKSEINVRQNRSNNNSHHLSEKQQELKFSTISASIIINSQQVSPAGKIDDNNKLDFQLNPPQIHYPLKIIQTRADDEINDQSLVVPHHQNQSVMPSPNLKLPMEINVQEAELKWRSMSHINLDQPPPNQKNLNQKNMGLKKSHSNNTNMNNNTNNNNDQYDSDPDEQSNQQREMDQFRIEQTIQPLELSSRYSQAQRTNQSQIDQFNINNGNSLVFQQNGELNSPQTVKMSFYQDNIVDGASASNNIYQ